MGLMSPYGSGSIWVYRPGPMGHTPSQCFHRSPYRAKKQHDNTRIPSDPDPISTTVGTKYPMEVCLSPPLRPHPRMFVIGTLSSSLVFLVRLRAQTAHCTELADNAALVQLFGHISPSSAGNADLVQLLGQQSL